MTVESTILYKILSEQRCLSQRTKARLPLLGCDFGAPSIALNCRLPRSSSRGFCRRFSRVFSPLSLSFSQILLLSFAVCEFPFDVAPQSSALLLPSTPSSPPFCPLWLSPWPTVATTTSNISRHCHTTVVCGGVQYHTTGQRTCPACNLPTTVDQT